MVNSRWVGPVLNVSEVGPDQPEPVRSGKESAEAVAQFCNVQLSSNRHSHDRRLLQRLVRVWRIRAKMLGLPLPPDAVDVGVMQPEEWIGWRAGGIHSPTFPTDRDVDLVMLLFQA